MYEPDIVICWNTFLSIPLFFMATKQNDIFALSSFSPCVWRSDVVSFYCFCETMWVGCIFFRLQWCAWKKILLSSVSFKMANRISCLIISYTHLLCLLCLNEWKLVLDKALCTTSRTDHVCLNNKPYSYNHLFFFFPWSVTATIWMNG